ncbi:hypothetical protein [Streptomyces sp. V3I7]|uniref:hypothetical protein n=1 Tax=Streptomyces sp. V3I7 TaxID=3042278 RepID=UPI002786CA87|nr:hypothetical protein [Streptomyces sp. V3I7]MDQ0992095.1 hypothetical protein [Streptomyces sp. V3I7]
MGWANYLGHAEFPKGKLNEVLADKHGTPLTNNALNNHIRHAKGWAMVEAESNRRCLVLPLHRFQKGIGDRTCEEHGIRKVKHWQP